MKCKNCGHANQPNALKCNACNAPFNGSMILEQSGGQNSSTEITCKNCGTSNSANNAKCKSCNAPLAGTNIYAQVESSIPTSAIVEDTDSCKDCGYPNVKGSSHCAACQYPMKNEATANDNGAMNQAKPQAKPLRKMANDKVIDPSMTVNPWVLEQEEEEEGFSLTPFVKGDLMENQAIEFGEGQVVLNRGNLDPKNTTITSNKQATIEHTENGWTIDNNSQLGTTFIQVSSPRILQDGDVILMGNMMYKFTTKK